MDHDKTSDDETAADYDSAIDSLSPELVARLRQGVETGRWPDGRLLTPTQREHSLQAIIAWEQRNLPEESRVGFIDRGRKGGAARAGPESPSEQLRWVATQEGEGQ